MQGIERAVESGTTIGREGCDITLSDPDVSRRHAQVQIRRDQLSIEDLGSTNGTFVNGERIDRAPDASATATRCESVRRCGSLRAPDATPSRVPDHCAARTTDPGPPRPSAHEPAASR